MDLPLLAIELGGIKPRLPRVALFQLSVLSALTIFLWDRHCDAFSLGLVALIIFRKCFAACT